MIDQQIKIENWLANENLVQKVKESLLIHVGLGLGIGIGECIGQPVPTA